MNQEQGFFRTEFYQMEIEGTVCDALLFTHDEAVEMRNRLVERGSYAGNQIRIVPMLDAATSAHISGHETSPVLDR
jgi:hypothetical protein